MQLAYREYGTGQPLIILHGLFGQSDNWNTLAKIFSENNLHVFTVDLRNHGLSPHHHEWNYEVMCDDLNEFITEHNLQNPILLGHSMGGKVVMYFELKYPGIAKKIIVADISPRAYESLHIEILEALNSVDFLKIKRRKEAETILLKYIPDFRTRQFLLKNIYWKDSANNLMDWRFNLTTITKEYFNIGNAVPDKKSNIETLFIRGEHSPYIREKDISEIEKRFPNYKLETIDAGHWLHAEKPNEFFEAIINFIKA